MQHRTIDFPNSWYFIVLGVDVGDIDSYGKIWGKEYRLTICNVDFTLTVTHDEEDTYAVR